MKGLLDESVAAPGHNWFGFSVDGVPTRNKNPDMGINLPESVEGLSPRHPLYDHVQNDQVDLDFGLPARLCEG